MRDYTDEFGRGKLNEQIDPERLVSEIGLDAAEIAWRKEFVDFDEADAERLVQFRDIFRDHADEIADSFYDHLSAFEQTQAVFDRSPKSIEQLRRTQKAYLMSLADGTYDETYFRNRARIGKIHELLDMPVKHYIGQYNVYYGLLLGLMTNRIHDRLAETVDTAIEHTTPEDAKHHVDTARLTRRLYEDVETSVDELHSLLKLLNLDMQVAVETYLQSRIDDVQVERDRFAALFENVPTPVVVVRIADSGMRVKRVNTAFEELFGYVAEDFEGEDFEQYLTPSGEDPRPIEDRGIVENLQTESDSALSEAEVTLETKFGQREFIRVSAPVDHGPYEDLEYAFYIDVTDQKQRQERLQVLSRVLRHDIRNRLNVVQGCAEVLSDEPDSETHAEMVDAIDHAADELLATSSQLWEVEQLITGDATPEPIELTSILDSLVEELRGQFDETAFRLSAPDETWVTATSALRVALENIIENGAEHNDADSPQVDVSVTESIDGEHVNVRVADNGPGIPESEYQILTGERERTQTEHTSGIGLWIVNWIITNNGGALHFSNNVPRGTIVTVRLPAPDQETVPDDRQS